MTHEPLWEHRLPVSNMPLCGESFGGYLLNLAHRLQVTPAHLATRTGLKTTKAVGLLDLTYSVTIPPDVQDRFSAATGVAHSRLDASTVSGIGDVLIMARAGRRIARSEYGNRWLNPGRTRACPRCLAENPLKDVDVPASGTAADTPALAGQSHELHTPHVQDLPVRARQADLTHIERGHTLWKRTWITPWAIACTRHGVLLIDQCPACKTPLGDSGKTNRRSLVVNVYRPVHHPAECRAILHRDEPCRFRLDTATTGKAPPHVLELQRLFDLALTQTGPEQHLKALPQFTVLGHPTSANQWLRDIRLTGLLLALTRSPTNPGTKARPTTPGQNSTRWDDVRPLAKECPTAVTAMTRLHLAAYQALNGSLSRTELHQLNEKADHIAGKVWTATKNKSGPSLALHEALHQHRRNMRQPQRLGIYLPRTQRLTSDHIPAYLPHDLFQRHLADMRRPSDHNPKRNGNERNLRRYAAMAMVMHLDSSGVGPAGAHLGYDQYLSAAACARASAAAQPHGGEPALFERIGRALEDLARQPPVNYQRRRQFFHTNWQIPDDEWALLKSAHPRQNRPWDERRVWFSAHIWTLVTHGDTLLAPMAANKRKESGATLAHDRTRWGQPILDHLNRLASQLASAIDQTPPDSTVLEQPIARPQAPAATGTCDRP